MSVYLQKHKNFIMTLANPSAGAKIGPVPAAFVNLHSTGKYLLLSTDNVEQVSVLIIN